MSVALPLASFITDFWNNQLVANDRQGVFLVLVGFVGSFAFIRMSTRMIRAEVSWWPGNIESESGLHVHHLVFGIITMMVAGTLGFAAFGHSPLTEICAFFFGIGAGLTIDEFALWVYLEDVYWAKQGRSSIDATVIAAALIGMIVVGVNPFEASDEGATAIESIASVAIVIFFIGASFLKGRRLHGILGIVLVPLAIYATCRIGKPDSPWAHRRYGTKHPKKQAKAEARFHPGRRTDRFKEAFRDIVGGKPSEGMTHATEEAVAATLQARDEMRAAAERVVHPDDRDESKK
jgi:lysyl-tRNA synthetase class 2